MNYPKRIMAAVFCILLFYVSVYGAVDAVHTRMQGEREGENIDMGFKVLFRNLEAVEEDTAKEEEKKRTLSDALLQFNSTVAEKLDLRGMYANLSLYITEDQYIIKVYPLTNTDYEVQQILAFKDFLDQHGISFAYFNFPTKYLDDLYAAEMFGALTYTNVNADNLVRRLREGGVNVRDLREDIAGAGLDIRQFFYKTDHHWTTAAGLWAAGLVAGELNRSCGYDIDLSLFDPDRFEKKTWENCWVGEQGRKIGADFAGRDDYTEIKPAFETSYTFKDEEGNVTEGSFDGFIDESVYDPQADPYKCASWHYSYKRLNCINHLHDRGKILMLCDSFGHVVEPFLSLGIHQIDTLIMRGEDEDFDLHQYILDNHYDTVLVCYVQTNIGAHDDPESSNYRMFNFNAGH